MENSLEFISPLCATPLINFKAKNPRPMENPHDFFLITSRKSTSFFNQFWHFCMLFLIPFEIPCPNSPCLGFFYNRVVIENMPG